MIITFTYSKQGNIRGELTIGRGVDGMGGWRLVFSFFVHQKTEWNPDRGRRRARDLVSALSVKKFHILENIVPKDVMPLLASTHSACSLRFSKRTWRGDDPRDGMNSACRFCCIFIVTYRLGKFSRVPNTRSEGRSRQLFPSCCLLVDGLSSDSVIWDLK